jgi:hypothetical protein
MIHELMETVVRLEAIIDDQDATDRDRVDAWLQLNPLRRVASQVADGVGIPHEAVMEAFQERRAEKARQEAHDRGEVA